MNAGAALRSLRAPDEIGAETRAWSAVRSAYAERPTPEARQLSLRAIVLAPIVILAALGVALSPAGASVRRWLGAALGIPRSAPALFKLPAAGSVLVTGSGAAWIVAADGSTRRLGVWRTATWSPRAKFIAATSDSTLAALDLRGNVRWKLDRPQVSDARWYAPSGWRIAYRSGQSLRAVAGDGTGDHLIATTTQAVAPAWRPDTSYELTYVSSAGMLITRDADTGATLWSEPAPAGTRKLAWSANGSRLLVLARHRALVFDASGTLDPRASSDSRAPIVDAAISPDGRRLALVRGGQAADVVVIGARGDLREVLPGAGLRQVTWSPDGRWLLITWPRANQWVFDRVVGRPRIMAVSRIAQQFARRAGAAARFPSVAGWCCAPTGATG